MNYHARTVHTPGALREACEAFSRITDLWRSKGFEVEVVIPPYAPPCKCVDKKCCYCHNRDVFVAYARKNGVLYRCDYWLGLNRWRHHRYVRYVYEVQHDEYEWLNPNTGEYELRKRTIRTMIGKEPINEVTNIQRDLAADADRMIREVYQMDQSEPMDWELGW